jgi:transposase
MKWWFIFMYYEKPKNKVMVDRNQLEMLCLDQLVPNDHIVRKIENAINFDFIYDYTKDYYCQDNGRPCLDTVILFKIVLINFLFGINSIRKTIEEIKVNMAYRWFLGISMTESVPNYSTFSQNYRRRYSDGKVFKKIFERIIMELHNRNYIDTSILFVDGTHIKASANRNKRTKKQVKIVTDIYHKQLEDEVNEFRELNGRDRYHSDDDERYTIDDETGEVKEVETKKTKEVTVSLTDPGSGMFVKGQHERQFAYVDMVACDKNGWIVAFDVNPGNMHDSKAFLPFYHEQLKKYKSEIICGDSAFLTALIAKTLQENNTNLLAPYSSPKGKRIEFGKKYFDYLYEIDMFMCPNRKLLVPWNISKDGYIEYKIHKSDCGDCPFKEKCLKNYSFKTVRRHLYDDCLILAREFRLSKEGKEKYKLRKSTIERAFAEGKEKHGLRFTRFRGLKKNRDYRSLLYACQNIKKIALLEFKRANNTNKLSYC